MVALECSTQGFIYLISCPKADWHLLPDCDSLLWMNPGRAEGTNRCLLKESLFVGKDKRQPDRGRDWLARAICTMPAVGEKAVCSSLCFLTRALTVVASH